MNVSANIAVSACVRFSVERFPGLNKESNEYLVLVSGVVWVFDPYVTCFLRS